MCASTNIRATALTKFTTIYQFGLLPPCRVVFKGVAITGDFRKPKRRIFKHSA